MNSELKDTLNRIDKLNKILHQLQSEKLKEPFRFWQSRVGRGILVVSKGTTYPFVVLNKKVSYLYSNSTEYYRLRLFKKLRQSLETSTELKPNTKETHKWLVKAIKIEKQLLGEPSQYPGIVDLREKIEEFMPEKDNKAIEEFTQQMDNIISLVKEQLPEIKEKSHDC